MNQWESNIFAQASFPTFRIPLPEESAIIHKKLDSSEELLYLQLEEIAKLLERCKAYRQASKLYKESLAFWQRECKEERIIWSTASLISCLRNDEKKQEADLLEATCERFKN